jgi:hypothetical protein
MLAVFSVIILAMMLRSERIELAIYKAVNRGPGPVTLVTTMPMLSQLTGEEDHAAIADRLKALDADNRLKLSKWQGNQMWPRGDSPDRFFFYTGEFGIEIIPQGRKYFEELEQRAEQESKPMRARKSPDDGNAQLMSPKKAIEILRPMVQNSAYLSGEPFGSPKREEWTHTAEGALARSFAPGSRILDNFGTAQSIAFNASDTDEELRRIANENLAAQVAVLKSAIEQLGWELEEEAPTKTTKPVDAAYKVETTPMSSRDVFVIHGRDERLRAGIFDFLRSLDLNPMEWSYAVGLTGKGAPYVGDVLDVAFSHAQAVVVLFSPDDVARLRQELCGQNEPPHEVNLTHQARPNVVVTENSVRAENAVVPSIREILVVSR